MRRFFSILTLALLFVALVPENIDAKKKHKSEELTTQKSEFRGAWIQTAWQDRYQRMTPAKCQAYLTSLVNTLKETGFNAIVFQVRPEGDAFYDSSYEPWSRFLTGQQGRAPQPVWDPMAFLIQLCHDRQMEFHAWINPYRITASKSIVMDKDHFYYQHPEWFVSFDDKLYLNPGLPESRAYIRAIVGDIVSRYDIDALHMDDYFYPYPVAGKEFDDNAAFEAYAPAMKIDTSDPDALGNFRRKSVDILIKSVHQDIQKLKPWVRFGISPFGIYRNKRSWEGGSDTKGTQCYDDLYADVLFWAKNGWIDYVIPQIYWEIGHKLADYTTLVNWWSKNIPGNCHLYIGQSIERSLDAPAADKPNLLESHTNFMLKLHQAADLGIAKGNCFWYAYQVQDNAFHIKDLLKQNVYTTPTLLPAYTNLDNKNPEDVKNLSATLSNGNLDITWTPADDTDLMQVAKYYNVYRFKKGEKAKITDCSHLIGQTSICEFIDKDIEMPAKYTYIITAMDACNNESKGVKKAFKLKAAKK